MVSVLLLSIITPFALMGSCAIQPERVDAVADNVAWRELSNDELISHLPVSQEEVPLLIRNRPDAIDLSREHPASAELRSRIVARRLTDADWIAAIRRSQLIAFHERWPEDRPLDISLRAPLWLGPYGAIRATPRLDGIKGKQRSFRATYGPGRAFEAVASLPRDTQHIAFDIELFGGPHSHSQRPVWRGTVAYPIVPVNAITDAIQAVSDPRFDAAVKNALSIYIGWNEGGPRPRVALWVMVRCTDAIRPFLERHSCRARVEFIDGDVVIDEVMIDLRRAEWAGLCTYYRDVLDEQTLRDVDLPNRLTLRITGSSEIAFSDLRRESYWSGQIIAPLSDFLEPDGLSGPQVQLPAVNDP